MIYVFINLFELSYLYFNLSLNFFLFKENGYTDNHDILMFDTYQHLILFFQLKKKIKKIELDPLDRSVFSRLDLSS